MNFHFFACAGSTLLMPAISLCSHCLIGRMLDIGLLSIEQQLKRVHIRDASPRQLEDDAQILIMR